MSLGHWNLWSLYWLLWVGPLFLIPEFWALFSGHPENTLSDNVWRLETSHWTFGHFFVAAFMLWLTFHFIFRMFR